MPLVFRFFVRITISRTEHIASESHCGSDGCQNLAHNSEVAPQETWCSAQKTVIAPGVNFELALAVALYTWRGALGTWLLPHCTPNVGVLFSIKRIETYWWRPYWHWFLRARLQLCTGIMHFDVKASNARCLLAVLFWIAHTQSMS